jgi:monoamine oxidase
MSRPLESTIVVGGGLAGLVVARDLSSRGVAVTLLEARPRLGGRVWFDVFDDTDEHIELGGNWVAPRYQPLMAAEIDRYGLELRDGNPGTEQLTIIAGERFHGLLPVADQDAVDFERGVWECMTAARRIDYGRPWSEQGVEDLDVSWADYVRGLHLCPAVEEYLMTMTSASDPELTSALNILVGFTAFDNSVWAVNNAIQWKFADGTTALVDAIAADARADIHLSTVATRIEHDVDRVVVTVSDGRTFSADHAVLATPVNTWSDVEFVPPLSPAKQEVVSAKHVGTGQKVWMQLGGMPDGGLFARAVGDGISWLVRDRRLPDGDDLYVGFTGAGNIDAADHHGVQDAVRSFAPDARLVRTFEHNWTHDPYAQGVWAIFRPGHFSRLHDELSRPEGRLHFAGSDLSFGNQVWMEGAFESAVQVVSRLLA